MLIVYLLSWYIHVNTTFIYLTVLPMVMARKITAIAGGKVKIEDNVEEIFEKIITPYGNGAKIDSQKKFIGKRAIVLILKD